MKRIPPEFYLPGGMVLALLLTWSAPAAPAKAAPLNAPGKPMHRDAQSPEETRFLTAYKSMSMADWLKERDMTAQAAELYSEALDLFQKLAAAHPQWQPEVVSFRIKFCREALEQLLKSIEQEASAPAMPDAARDAPHMAQEQAAARSASRRTPDIERSAGSNLDTASSRIVIAPAGQQPEIHNLESLTLRLQQAALLECGREYVEAHSMYLAILQGFPQDPWALKGACRCCLRLGYMDQARALIRRALALSAPDAEINLLAALIACNDGCYQEAIAFARHSLKQNSACPEAYVILGVALASNGRIDEAREETKRALMFNPKFCHAYYNLARLSLWQKPTDLDRARVHYQNALRHGAEKDPELDKLLAE